MTGHDLAALDVITVKPKRTLILETRQRFRKLTTTVFHGY